MKNELYKIIAESSPFIKEITANLNKIIRETDIPHDWKTPRTILTRALLGLWIFHHLLGEGGV